jgi:predicted translin family RNA/ssDNA-binding protein
MINRDNFKKLKNEIEKFTEKREQLIKQSRDIIGLSKNIIYSVHRDDMKKAEQHIKDIKKQIKQMQNIVEKDPKLAIGSYKVAVQEYVESICYYSVLKDKKLPTNDELDVDGELYLQGICDLTGELARNAYNSAIKGDTKKVEEIKDFVEGLYNELMLFSFRSGELRKKFDQIKYDLKRMEQLVFDLKVKK